MHHYNLLYLLIIPLFAIIKYFRSNHIEHFYTLFLPYYYPETIKKYTIYDKNFTSSNMIKYSIKFIISNQQLRYTYFHLFLKSLIAYNYPIVNINIFTKTNNDHDIINHINKETDTLGIISAPILANEIVNRNYDNINYMTSLNDQYVFILSPIDKNLDTLIDLNNKTLGVGLKDSLWERCANDIFHNMKMEYNPYYGTLKEMLEKLYNNNIDAILITDSYPSDILNFIFYNFYNLQLISLEKIKNMDIIYTKTYVDLNRMPGGYLPKPTYREKHVDYLMAPLFSNKNRLSLKYLFYTSNFMTLKFSNHLICNKNLNDKLGYMITKHIFNNKLLLKKSDNAYITLPIKFNEGSKKYYIDKGYMTYNSNINCSLMVGEQKCTKKTLKNTLLNYDPYYNLL